MEKKNILRCNMLFSDNIPDIDYEPVFEPFTLGIQTEYENGIKKYIVYSNNEKGIYSVMKEFTDFNEAIEYARIMWDGLKSYYRGLLMIYDRLQNDQERGLKC